MMRLSDLGTSRTDGSSFSWTSFDVRVRSTDACAQVRSATSFWRFHEAHRSRSVVRRGTGWRSRTIRSHGGDVERFKLIGAARHAIQRYYEETTW